MLSIIRHILYLALAFVLQMTWSHHLRVFELQPDFILLVLVAIALASGHLHATVMGFCVGLLQDTYMTADLGLNALAKSIVGFAVGVGRTRIMAEAAHVQVLIIAAAVLLHNLIFFAGHSAVPIAEVPYFWIRYGPGQAIYTGLIGAIFAYGLLLRRRYLPL